MHCIFSAPAVVFGLAGSGFLERSQLELCTAPIGDQSEMCSFLARIQLELQHHSHE
jgi:hypothetical protein